MPKRKAARAKTCLCSKQMKKFHKSLHNRDIFGVFGGIAEYYDISPHSLRIGWIVITLMTGFLPGIFIYLVATVVIPEPPIGKSQAEKVSIDD